MQAVSAAAGRAPTPVGRPTASRRASRSTTVRVAATSLVDATLNSGHWSGGSPLILPNGTVTHSATQEQLEVIRALQPMFAEQILPLLTPVEELWQPSDYLPSSQDPDQFYEEVGCSCVCVACM